MKLLLTTMYYRPENLPINSVVDLLRKNSIQVDVLTAKPNYPEGIFFSGFGFFSKIIYEEQTSKVYRLPILPRGKGKLTLALNYLSFIFSGVAIAPFLLTNQKYDCIFVYANSPITKTIPAIFIAKLKKIPVIVWVQDLWPESILYSGIDLPRFIVSLVKLVTKFIYKNVDIIATQSKSFNKKISKDFDISPRKIVHLPNTIDPIFSSETTNVLLPERFLNNLGRFNITFTGNIGDAQNLDDILKAAKFIQTTNPDIRFFIIGSGSKLEYFKDIVQKEEIKNLFFIGPYPLNHMPAFIAKSDLMLLSLKNEEIYNLTVPNKLQSYMASGKSILGNVSGASADLIESSGCGFTIEPDQPKKLAKKIIEISLYEPNELIDMGMRGEKYFKDNFSNASFIKKFLSLLEE